MIENAELTVRGVADGQFDAVNTQNDVFQGLGVQTDFRMDHQVIRVDRVELIVDEELAFSANYIKKLQMIMGVGNGMPVAAVLRTGDI